MANERITLFLGGTSSERDVSLASGVRIAKALRDRGYVVSLVDPAVGPMSADTEQALMGGKVVQTKPPSREELDKMARESLPKLVQNIPLPSQADAVFLGLHGGYGEDGTIQALLDVVGTAYTGSGHLASAIAMDKDVSKHLFRNADVPTARWVLLSEGGRAGGREGASAAAAMKDFGLPL